MVSRTSFRTQVRRLFSRPFRRASALAVAESRPLVELLESRVVPSVLPPPNPIDPTRGEANLLRVVQMMADKQNLNAQDHFPVPFTIIVSAAGATPTVKNWKAGAPIQLDADRSKATGQGGGGNDIQLEVNTDRYTNSQGNPDWRLRLNVNRLGTSKFTQNLSVMIAFPWNAFDVYNETLPAQPNLLMGFQTRLAGTTPGTTDYIYGTPGGIAPATLQMVLTPHILAGTTHDFEWTIDTTGAANPLTFFSGEFDGDPGSNTIVNALGWSAYVQNVPAHIEAELKVAENAIGSPAVDSKMDLHWTASSRSLTTFDYCEAESKGAASSPQTANYATQIVADTMPTDERFVLHQDEANGVMTWNHTSNESIHEMTFMKRRSDGLALTGVASDDNALEDAVPKSVALTLGLRGYETIDVDANTLDLHLQNTQVGGFNNTSQFFEQYPLEYVALRVKNSPDQSADFDGTQKSFTLLVTHAGEVAPYTEMVLDDNGRIGSNNAPQSLELPEKYDASPDWHLWSIVDDGTHGTAVARALDVTRQPANPNFGGSATFDHDAATITEMAELRTVVAHPLQTYLKAGLLSAVQPPIPLSATEPDPYIEVFGHVEDVPIGRTWVSLDFPLSPSWQSESKIAEICMAGHIGSLYFGVILEDNPTNGSFDFRPEGSLVVKALNDVNNTPLNEADDLPDFFSGNAAIAYDVNGFNPAVLPWPNGVQPPGFHAANETFFPDNTQLKEARLRLDQVPSLRATWHDEAQHTYIDIDTDEVALLDGSNPYAYVGGVQIQISAQTTLAGTTFNCDNIKTFLPAAATDDSPHYAELIDKSGEQTLKFGIFGVDSFHFHSDDTKSPSKYSIDFNLDPSRPGTAATVDVDTNSVNGLGTFFGGSTVTGQLAIAYVPSQLNIQSDFDPSFCTSGLFPPGLLTLTDINQNFTVDGTNVFVHAHNLPPVFCINWNIAGPTTTVSILSQNADATPARTGYVQLLFQNPAGLPGGTALFGDPANPLKELRIRLDNVPSLSASWTTGVDPQHINIDTTAAAGPFSILGGVRLGANTQPPVPPLPPASPFVDPGWDAFPDPTGSEDHYLRMKDLGSDKLIEVGIFGVNSFDVKTSNATSQTTIVYDGDIDRNFTAAITSNTAGRFFNGHDTDLGLKVNPLPRNITLNIGAQGKNLSYNASGGITSVQVGGTQLVDPGFNPMTTETSGKYDDILLDLLINNLPSSFSYAINPAGSLTLTNGGGASVGDLTARLRSNTGLPSSDGLFGGGVPVKDVRVRLDTIPSFGATWSDTGFDFNTTANDVFLGGAQLAVSSRYDDLAPLTPASSGSAHYVHILDRDLPVLGNVKRLSVGAFGIDQVTYTADKNTRFTNLHYDNSGPRLLTVTVDTKFGSRFFPAYDIAPVDALTPTLRIDKVPALWDLRTNLATVFDYNAHGSGINAIQLRAIIDDADDNVANGAVVGASLPGNPAAEADLPSRIYFVLENGAVAIIDGKANMVNTPDPGDDGIGPEDDGFFADVRVIDGGFDLNGDNAVNGADDGRLLGLTVINGGIDLNDDGVVNGDDDGSFGNGAHLKMNANIDSIHVQLTSQDNSRGVFGKPYRLVQLDATQVPGEWGMNWGDGRLLLESRNAAGNPAPLGQVTVLASTSKVVADNNAKIAPFQDNGPVETGPVLNGSNGTRINYSAFTQEIDKRYYDASGAPGVFPQLRNLYAGSEELDGGDDFAVARKEDTDGNGSKDAYGFASFQFTGFQRISWIPNSNGGKFIFRAPHRGEHPFFAGFDDGGKFTTLQLQNVPDEIVATVDTTRRVTYQAADDVNNSIGKIDVYRGPLPKANDDDEALRLVMLNTPGFVDIGWNFGVPNGGAYFNADRAFTVLFLTQNGSNRIVGGGTLEDLHIGYGIELLSLDLVYHTESVLGIDVTFPTGVNLFRAKAGLDNDADGLTPDNVKDLGLIDGNPGHARFAGFINYYERRNAPKPLAGGGPGAGAKEYVPLITAMVKNFQEFSIGVDLNLDPLYADIGPFSIVPFAIVDGQTVFDFWENGGFKFTLGDIPAIGDVADIIDTVFGTSIADIGLKNEPDYTDNSPIHVLPGLFGDPIGNLIFSGGPTYELVGWHNFGSHFDPFSPMVAALAPPVGWFAGTPLTSPTLAALVPAALARWEQAGVPAPLLEPARRATMELIDLPGLMLGSTMPGRIQIDADAAGWGWFIDPTPWADEEFGPTGTGAAAGRMDLLTVLTHEIGHLLGFEHEDEGALEAQLAPGVRLGVEEPADVTGPEGQGGALASEDGLDRAALGSLLTASRGTARFGAMAASLLGDQPTLPPRTRDDEDSQRAGSGPLTNAVLDLLFGGSTSDGSPGRAVLDDLMADLEVWPWDDTHADRDPEAGR